MFITALLRLFQNGFDLLVLGVLLVALVRFVLVLVVVPVFVLGLLLVLLLLLLVQVLLRLYLRGLFLNLFQ